RYPEGVPSTASTRPNRARRLAAAYPISGSPAPDLGGNTMRRPVLALLLALTGMFSVHGGDTKKEDKVIETMSGLKYVDIKLGGGPEAKRGDVLAVLYIARLKDGKVFDASRDPADPFVFKVGRGIVIKGWDEGIPGMKAGGKRLLIIPPHLAYGERGSPPRV